jgi:probable phosphoglycerate mutase
MVSLDAMEFVFIRHGQPAWSVDDLNQPNPFLTELGHEQARLVAERLADDEAPISEILVSPALRAQQTAAPLAAATGIAPTTIDGLTELRLPEWHGIRAEDVQRIFAESRDRSPEEWWEGLAGGERFRDFHDRISATMTGILADRSVRPDERGRPHLWHVDTDPKRIVIVAHAGTNSTALGYLLGAEPTPWEWERFVLGHASIARISTVPLAGEHVFSLRAFNDREHLPPSMRTR